MIRFSGRWLICFFRINVQNIRFMIFTPKVKLKLNEVDNYGLCTTSNLSNLTNHCRLSVNYGINILHSSPQLTSICFKMIENDAIFALASSIVKTLINSPWHSCCCPND